MQYIWEMTNECLHAWKKHYTEVESGKVVLANRDIGKNETSLRINVNDLVVYRCFFSVVSEWMNRTRFGKKID